MPIVQPGQGPYLNNAIDDPRTSGEIARQTAMQRFYEEQAARMAQEQAALAEAQAREQAAIEAAAAPPEPAPAPAPAPAPSGRGDGFVDPRLSATPPAPTAQPRPFVQWLGVQTYEPTVKTLEQFQAAPVSVQRALLDTGITQIAKGDPELLKNIAKEKKEAEKFYLVKDKTGLGGDLADIGLAAASGLGSSLKSIVDLVAPASGLSDLARKGLAAIDDAKTPESKRAKAFLDQKLAYLNEHGTGRDQILAWLEHGLKESPTESVAQLAGAMSTMFIGRAAGAAHALKGAAVLGGVQGGGAARGSAYDTALEDAKAKGLTGAEAEAAAENASSLSNMGGKVLANAALGVVAGSTGVERLLMGPANKIAQMAAANTAKLAQGRGARVALGTAKILSAGAAEAVPEMAQGALETYTSNRASVDAGLRPEAKVWDGVELAAGQSAMLGQLAGSSIRGVQAFRGDPAKPGEPEAAPGTPLVAPPAPAAPAPVMPPAPTPDPAAPVTAPATPAEPSLPAAFHSDAHLRQFVKAGSLTPEHEAWLKTQFEDSDSGTVDLAQAKSQGIVFEAPVADTPAVLSPADAAAREFKDAARLTAERDFVMRAKPKSEAAAAAAREEHNLPPALHGMLLGGKDTEGESINAKLAFEGIARTASSGSNLAPVDRAPSKVEKGIAKWLAENIDPSVRVEAGVDTSHLNIPDHLQEKAEAARAFYLYASDNPNSGTIYLNAVRGMNRHALMHEGVHAVTNQYLEADPATLTGVQAAAQKSIGEMYLKLAQNPNPNMGPVYAFANVKEFVAEGLSNPSFQAFLRATPWEVDQSMWQQFKAQLRSMLNLGENVVPDNAFEALLDATDTMVAGRGQSLATLSDSLDAVKSTRPNIDTAFARLPGEGKHSARGSATWNPDTQMFDVIWHRPNGRVQKTSTIDMDDAKTWLRGRQADVTVDVVQTKSRPETQVTAQLKGMVTDLESMTPGAAKAYEAFNALVARIPGGPRIIPPTAVYAAVRALTVGHQVLGSRYNATDKVQDVVAQYRAAMVAGSAEHTAATDLLSRVGSDAMLRKQAEGVAERRVAGFGKKHWADHREATIKMRRDLVKKGVPDQVLSDLAYAFAAAQRNAVSKAQYPTDVDGRGKQDDYAKFSWVADRNGNIVGASDSAPVPPGGKLWTGTGAAMEFKKQFAAQYPQHVAEAQAMLDGIRAGNRHVLDYQLANGAITPAQHKDLAAVDYYLPMKQTDTKSTARIRQALGRSTKAVDPMAQWMAEQDMRIESAVRSGSIQAIGMALQQMPMPHIATVNSVDAKLAPSTDGGNTSAVGFAKRDWRGDNSVVFRVGDESYQMVINDPDLLRALKPDILDGGAAKAMHAARSITGFLSFVRVSANPAFIAKQIAWDPIAAIANMQGAFVSADGGGAQMTNMQAAKLSAKLLAGVLGNMKGAARGQLTSQFGKQADPVRRLYDAQGGGIRIEAKYGFGDNQVNPLDAVRGEVQRETRVGTALARTANVGSNVVHGIGAIGHISSDAIRFTAFKNYLEMQNGKAFSSEADLMQFVAQNPNHVATAITGSKNIIGNFERLGSMAITRVNFPFFNAGMVGTTQVLPQVLGSSWGRKVVTTVAGLATLAALAQFDDAEDEAEDGDSKFAASPRSDDSLTFGTVSIPMPPELHFAVTGGKLLAAVMSGRFDDISKANLWDSTKRALINLSPVRSPDFEDAGALQALGLVGMPLMLMGGQDSFGKSVLPARTDPGAPERLQARPQDSASATEVADAIYKATRYLPGGSADVAPGTVTSAAQMFGGAIYGMANAWDKAQVEDVSGAMAAVAYVTKAYTYDRDATKFDLMQRKDEATQKLYADATALDPDGLKAIQDSLKTGQSKLSGMRSTSGKTLSQMAAALAQARRDGDSDAYQQLLEEREALGQRRAVEIGKQINMLRY